MFKYKLKNQFTKEEIQELIEYYKNHSLGDTADRFGATGHIISAILVENKVKKHSISESMKLAQNKFKQTCLERYGVEYPAQSLEIWSKYKLTCLSKYGVDNALKSKEVREKTKLTCLEKYGVEWTSLIESAKEKRFQTNLERYGSISPFGNKDILDKIRQNWLDKYGVDHFTKSQEYLDILNNRTSEEKLLILQREFATKKERGTFNTSKPEEDYYLYLLTLYDENDIIRLFYSEQYPFNCDFYIVSEDLYIECNYSWTHGPHPFNKDNENDLKLLEEWKIKAETSDYYKQAIYIWTDLDIRKLLKAKENNLNYKIIY